MKTKIIFILFLMWSTLVFAGEKKEIKISAASALTDVVSESVKEYQNSNKNIKILCNFASSGVLRNQIVNGAPIDIFMFAGIEDARVLNDYKLIADNKFVNLCRNSIVCAVNKKSGLSDLKGFESLKDERIKKIAVPSFESSPAGKYSKAVFIEYGIFEEIKSKIIFTETVRQALSYIEIGNVDAALFFKTDYLISKNLSLIAEAGNINGKPIIYTGGVLINSRYLKESQKFLEYFTGLECKNIFKKYGFITE